MEQETLHDIDLDQIAVETIQDISCLVTMTQHKWGAKRTDYAATRDLKEAKRAHGDAGYFKKNLLNGSKAGMSKVTTAMSKAYRAHVAMTLPWGQGHARIISNAMLLDYMKEMNVHQTELAEAKNEWLQTLPQEIANAIKLNGDMGRADEYPSPNEIVNCFWFEFDFSPVPDSRGFSGLPDGFRERFADIYEKRARNAAATAQHEGVERLVAAVASFADVLRSEKPRIYESTLDQLRVLHSVAAAFNISKDDKVTAALDRLQADFLCYTKDQLTSNTDNQRKAVEAADNVLKSLGIKPAPSDSVGADSDTPEGGALPSVSPPEGGESCPSPEMDGSPTLDTSEPQGEDFDPELSAALLGGNF